MTALSLALLLCTSALWIWGYWIPVLGYDSDALNIELIIAEGCLYVYVNTGNPDWPNGVYYDRLRDTNCYVRTLVPELVPWTATFSGVTHFIQAPLIYITLLAAIYPVLWIAGNRRRTLHGGRSMCQNCGYCVDYLPSDRCPECGTTIAS